jgi:NADH:ubiquinone oxidoreductase subunit D
VDARAAHRAEPPELAPDLAGHARHGHWRADRFLYTFREREEILRLFEAVAGQRMMTSYFRIGGLSMEPPLDFSTACRHFITFPEKIDEYSNLLTGNPIFMNR